MGTDEGLYVLDADALFAVIGLVHGARRAEAGTARRAWTPLAVAAGCSLTAAWDVCAALGDTPAVGSAAAEIAEAFELNCEALAVPA